MKWLDHAQLDIKLVREDGSVAKPWLTIVIDDYSRVSNSVPWILFVPDFVVITAAAGVAYLAAGDRPLAETNGIASPGNQALGSAFVPFVRCTHRDRTKTYRSLCERSARCGLVPAAVRASRSSKEAPLSVSSYRGRVNTFR
jgi:hypothetical protein